MATITRPPSRYYDPALDSTLRASKRGLSQLITDTDLRDQPRLREDYQTNVGDINRQSGRSLEDLVRDRTRTSEDYTRNLSQLQRNYDQLGNQQSQAAAGAGVAHGGALEASAAKRAANQANEKVDIDTGKVRADQDIDTSTRRVGEDTTEQTRLANQGYARGSTDLTQQVQRAQSELGSFTQDTASARYNQAIQAGWKPPGKGKKGKGK